ncbi:MAG: D-2-hydroxyacid dehydrogenase [bacterium]|nr:D-2-hydroxyacid dehydrogenase [bacterium]
MEHILVVIPVQDRHKTYLESKAPNAHFIYSSPEEVSDEQLAQANILIGNVPTKRLHAPSNLRWMQLNSAGSDVYCQPNVLDSKTILTNATGAYGLAISEYMLGVSLSLQNKLFLYRDNQREHLWRDEGNVSSIEGSTTLVVGLGDIGGSYARKMKALGSYTIGIRRTATDKPDYLDELYALSDLDELLPRADFVALSLPNSSETYHLMDERRLLLMKSSAILINVGRGTAIDTDALLHVLNKGHLAGCAVDVTDPEPLPPTHPLWDAPRMIITPHISGFYHLPETFERIVRIAGENLEAFLAGKPLRNVVDFSTGYRKR